MGFEREAAAHHHSRSLSSSSSSSRSTTFPSCSSPPTVSRFLRTTSRGRSLFFSRDALSPSSLSSSNAESLLSFPSLSFSFFLSLSRERETNNATPTTNFVRSFSFRRCSKRASNSIDNYTKRMRFRLSLLLLERKQLSPILARYTQNTNTTAKKKSVVVLYVVVYVAQSTRALGAAALLYQKAL